MHHYLSVTDRKNQAEHIIYWGGEQAAWWGPMAIAVIVGLLFSTFLTLILVPVLYSVIERGKQAMQQLFFGQNNNSPATK